MPSFIYAFQKQLEQSVLGWNEGANKTVKSEIKIKDVCAECNNGILGDLDSYGKNLLTDSGLLVQNYKKLDLSLSYDYPRLLRWLLKISFNSSRMDGIHSPVFKQYIPFILGTAPLPPRNKIATVLSLAAPEIIPKGSVTTLPYINAAEGSAILNPFLVRISYGAIPSERFIHRIIFFGPAIFQLALFQDGVLPGHAASQIRSLLKQEVGGVELNEKRRVVTVKAGKQTWLDLYGPQSLRERANSEARV